MNLLFVLVVAAGVAGAQSLRFQAWAKTFNKTYSSQSDEELATHNFEATVRRIDALNAGNNSASFGLNQFSDWSLEAFHKYADCHKPLVKNNRTPLALDSIAPPDAWDWRDKGAVTGVKNQGNCGSCWSFATTGMTEGANFLINKNLTSLSEQDLVDCATGDASPYPNDGCNGGRADWGSEYIKRNGVDTEAEYPYKAVNGQCHQQSPAAAYLASYTTLPKDEDQLKAAVFQYGPVAVAIDVTDTFANYHSGVFVDSTCKNGDFDVNHAVLVVGYGTMDGSDYWIVKNSWGASWGNNGFVLMRRNYNNMCGIVTDAVYGVAKKL